MAQQPPLGTQAAPPGSQTAEPANAPSNRGNVTAGILAGAIVVILVHAIQALFPGIDDKIDKDVTAAFTTIVTFMISYWEP